MVQKPKIRCRRLGVWILLISTSPWKAKKKKEGRGASEFSSQTTWSTHPNINTASWEVVRQVPMVHWHKNDIRTIQRKASSLEGDKTHGRPMVVINEGFVSYYHWLLGLFLRAFAPTKNSNKNNNSNNNDNNISFTHQVLHFFYWLMSMFFYHHSNCTTWTTRLAEQILLETVLNFVDLNQPLKSKKKGREGGMWIFEADDLSRLLGSC